MSDRVLQEVYESFRTWTKSTFEAELTAESVSLVEDYVDVLTGKGSQLTLAIRNTLASEGYSPIRNAYHVHELYEARTFAERGFDYEPYESRTPGLSLAFRKDPSVHLAACLKHCTYLASVAASRGIAVEVGTLVRLDFFTSGEQQDRILAETELLNDPINESAAVGFLAGLFTDVPKFFGLLNDVIAPSSYLIRRHGQVIQKVLESQ